MRDDALSRGMCGEVHDFWGTEGEPRSRCSVCTNMYLYDLRSLFFFANILDHAFYPGWICELSTRI